MKYIKLVLDNLDIKPNSEIKGHVTVDYPGMYDGIVINTLIMNSNELIVYKSYNDEKIQYREKFSLDVHSTLMFLIIAKLEVSYGPETVIVDAPIFQVFVPLIHLEEDNMIYTQWTIFRELN